jgi:hypothetical protein
MTPRFLPVALEEQHLHGTFADAVNRLVDLLELSAFGAHYGNDTNGSPVQAAGVSAANLGTVAAGSINRQRSWPVCLNDLRWRLFHSFVRTRLLGFATLTPGYEAMLNSSYDLRE